MNTNSNTSLSPSEARIRELLGKYFLGMTSTAEENELRDSLSRISLRDADAELRADAELFLSLASAASVLPPVPEGFEADLADQIDSLAAATSRRSRPFSRLRIYAWLSAGVAAAVAGILFLSPVSGPVAAGDQGMASGMMASVADDFDPGIVEITDPRKAEKIVNRSIAMLGSISRAAVRQANSSLKTIQL